MTDTQEDLGPVAGTSVRVTHPLGWTFEAVGSPADVQQLWEDWLEFLKPRLLEQQLITVTSGEVPSAPLPIKPKLTKKPRTKPHWTQLPENKERVAAMVAKRHGKTRTCTNCGVGIPAGKPCIMCGSTERLPTPAFTPETPKERVDRALDVLRTSER